jgi:hypothetical protein
MPITHRVREWMILHGRPQDHASLTHDAPAWYDGLIKVNLEN